MAHDLLAGLTVVLVARGPGANYCGRLLGDAGAEVIAVEPPAGSAIRRLPPFLHDRPGSERSLEYLYTGVNRRSATLDLARPEGRELFLRLLSRADALVEDAAPGELAAFGIDDAAVAAARPGLAWLSLTPFGQSGPYTDLAWSNLTLQALSGWLSFSGESEREPVRAGGRVAEHAPGLLAAIATLAVLLEEDGDPAPRHADVAVLEQMVTLHPPYELASSYAGGLLLKRTGNRLPSTHPFTIVPCDGGRDFIGAIHLTHLQWELLCRMMGIDHLLDDPALQTNAGRVANADRIDAAMAPWLLERTAEECFHTAQAWRIPFTLVPNAATIMASPQHGARGFFMEQTHPEASRYRAPGPAFSPAEGVRLPDRPAPALGADNDAIYAELGLAGAEIDALRAAGVI